MLERKQVLLRMDPTVHDALARWAADEFRSLNAHIEMLLRRALDDAGRMPKRAGPLPKRGRPPSTRRPRRDSPTARQTGRMVVQDLHTLLARLSVRQRPGTWCMVTGIAVPDDITIEATIVEDEGTTMVMATSDAERLGVHPDFVAAWLTLEVASSLHSVGLTAAVATALADAQIPCNVLAGYHHDHLLVPAEEADPAIAVLEQLRNSHAP